MTDASNPTSLSPLHSTSPTAIDELFLADPLSLGDAQFDALITEMRRRRSAFASEEAAKAAKAAKGKSAKEPKAKVDASVAAVLDKPISELTLDDL